jgi:putative transposase
LTVRRWGGLKRSIGTQAPVLIPIRPNDRWSLNFVANQMTDGRRSRILAIMDDCARECLTRVADTPLSVMTVARELDWVLAERGRPKKIVSDNGSEVTANAILAGLTRQGAGSTLSHPARQYRMASSKASTPSEGREVERDAVLQPALGQCLACAWQFD